MKKNCAIYLVSLFLCGPLLAETPPSAEAAPEEATEDSGETTEASGEGGEWEPLSHGIRYQIMHEGDGTKAALWASVYLHYRLTAEDGTILEDTYTDGDHGGRAHKFAIGSGTLPEALEIAVMSMRERDRRTFLIPAELFDLYDYHSHTEGEEHDEEEHAKVASSIRPGSVLRAELSLLWVRLYDPANFNRFRDSTQ